jgi:uncharacterized tellurite resistance protein B-like protein
MNILKLLGLCGDEKPSAELGRLGDGLGEILLHKNPEEMKLITGYAGLLGKIAYADMELSDVEIEEIKQILSDKLALMPDQMSPIFELFEKFRVQLFSLEGHLYARMINEIYDKEQKFKLLDALFAVAAADKSICAEEDAVLWTIAKELRFSHKEFVSVRGRYKEHLDVLKGI